jgi:hypothetical protein
VDGDPAQGARGGRFEAFDPLTSDVLNVQSVAEALVARGPNIVLEWGFVPGLLGKVRQPIRNGFEQWWFTGDEVAARRAFLVGDIRLDEALFDRQLESIHDSWERIAKVFDGHILDVVRSAPEGFAHLPPDEIFRLMVQMSRSARSQPSSLS